MSDLTQEEISVLGQSMMPKDLYMDLRKMYDGEDEWACQVAEALESEDKWETFSKENKVEYKPLDKIEGGEIKDSGEVFKFHSAQEQDEWLRKKGLI